MERDAEIQKAKRVMRKFTSKRGRKRGYRVHQRAAADTVHRLRSLEGLCGKCKNMQLNFFRSAGKEVVKVNCKAGNEPFMVYYNTPLGSVPDCNDHEPVGQ